MEEQGTGNKKDTSKSVRMSSRMKLYIGFAIVVIVFVGLLIFTLQGHNAANLVTYDNTLVPTSISGQLNVPNNISNIIGIGTAQYLDVLNKINNKPVLSQNGKVEILYIGADYCPFCAAERWAMIIALSRFGNFSNLHFMTSSASDYSPSTPTFTFYNSTYTSPYINFVSVEEYTNQISGSYYRQLQTPTNAELSLISHYDVNGTIPFILFANYSYLIGATYDPYSILYGKNWTTILQEIYNTSSVQSQSIIGSANLVTEQICNADNNTPKSVCSQPYVTKIRQIIG